MAQIWQSGGVGVRGRGGCVGVGRVPAQATRRLSAPPAAPALSSRDVRPPPLQPHSLPVAEWLHGVGHRHAQEPHGYHEDPGRTSFLCVTEGSQGQIASTCRGYPSRGSERQLLDSPVSRGALSHIGKRSLSSGSRRRHAWNSRPTGRYRNTHLGFFVWVLLPSNSTHPP